MQDRDPSDICKKKFSNPLKRIRVIIRTTTHGRTDGQTDRRTDKQGESSIPPLNFVLGGIIYTLSATTRTTTPELGFPFKTHMSKHHTGEFIINGNLNPMVCTAANANERLKILVSTITSTGTYLNLGELEQLECLHSEDTPRRLMITHSIDSLWIPSQKKTKSKLQIKVFAKFLIFDIIFICDKPYEVA